MFAHDHPLDRLIDEIKKIPGIGAKSAQRIALYLIGLPQEDTDRLTEAIQDAKKKIFYCSVCNSLTHIDPCNYCTDNGYSDEFLCVVEEPFNILSIEKSGGYRGLYHVLHGVISPIDGVGPDQLRLKNLLSRIADGTVQEIIVATNPTTEGEATAIYLSKLLKPLEIKISRIALGIPVGSDIEFADSLTISRALSGRSVL